jgi:hypothetical protein
MKTAISLLLAFSEIACPESAGIAMVTGTAWHDEEPLHTLRSISGFR